jgi:uncharacterized protein RhaS with RHS repeats
VSQQCLRGASWASRGQLYSFTYDNNGDTATTTYPDSTVATMTWDYENRMTQPLSPSGRGGGLPEA